MQLYCESLTEYKRLPTREVKMVTWYLATPLAIEAIPFACKR